MIAPAPAPIAEPQWISAPTTGILHVAGEGYSRKDCADGVQLLCGWVIHSTTPVHPRDSERVGKKCRACSRWIRTHGGQSK